MQNLYTHFFTVYRRNLIIFLDKSTNFTEFIQLCIFFSNIDDELLSACSLMLVPNVNYNKITVQDLNKLIGILEADRRYKPNLVFPLFQVYDKSQKGYLTYDEYMTFADKNRSIFDIMIQFRYAITTLMFTPAHWEIMNEKVQSLEFILTYKHEHGKFPPLSPCRYIQWIKSKGPHPYYFDFEPVTEDVGKEQKFALASYLIQFGENIMECLEIILEQQHTYVWDQNKVEETEMNTTATTFTYKPDEKMKYSTVTTARNRYKKSIIVPEETDNVITVVSNETPK